MPKRQNNSKKGFTIIEVVLVLAIAGLIFLAVFIALPALQRGQRDSTRERDLTRLQDAISRYQSNNRNALPTGNGKIESVIDPTTNKQVLKTGTSTNPGTWGYFYKHYLLVESGAAGGNQTSDTYEDPNGDPYNIEISVCASGASCKQANTLSFKDQKYTITVVKNGKCEGETIVFDPGARRVATAYKMEGGGTKCLNN